MVQQFLIVTMNVLFKVIMVQLSLFNCGARESKIGSVMGSGSSCRPDAAYLANKISILFSLNYQIPFCSNIIRFICFLSIIFFFIRINWSRGAEGYGGPCIRFPISIATVEISIIIIIIFICVSQIFTPILSIPLSM